MCEYHLQVTDPELADNEEVLSWLAACQKAIDDVITEEKKSLLALETHIKKRLPSRPVVAPDSPECPLEFSLESICPKHGGPLGDCPVLLVLGTETIGALVRLVHQAVVKLSSRPVVTPHSATSTAHE